MQAIEDAAIFAVITGDVVDSVVEVCWLGDLNIVPACTENVVGEVSDNDVSLGVLGAAGLTPSPAVSNVLIEV